MEARLMKLLGKSSVSSVLGGVLTVVWVLLVITTAAVVLLGVVGVVKPDVIPLTEQPRYFNLQFSPAVNNGNAKPVHEPEMFQIEKTEFWIKEPALIVNGTVNYRAGSPFTGENAVRLRYVGWTTIGIEIWGAIFYNVLGVLLKNGLSIKGVTLSIRWDSVVANLLGKHLAIIFLGFVILVIAEVFRQGTVLREEQELTI
jgi:hypothetical protein